MDHLRRRSLAGVERTTAQPYGGVTPRPNNPHTEAGGDGVLRLRAAPFGDGAARDAVSRVVYRTHVRREGDEEIDDNGFGESSRYAAHLDRGWSMLAQGEYGTARAAAHHANELRPDAPDAAVLLGAVALSEGQADESVDWYERAIELDPEYPEPYAALAQAYLYDLNRPDDASRVCDVALSLDILMPVERLDLGILSAEAAAAGGHDDDAIERLGALPDLDVLARVLGASVEAEGDEPSEAAVEALTYLAMAEEDPDEEDLAEASVKCVGLGLRLARTYLDLGEWEGACDWLHWVVAHTPTESDAWYLLSEAELLSGRPRESAFAALQTFRLDNDIELPDWAPSPAVVHRAIVETVTACQDATIMAQVEDANALMVLVHEVPSLELVLEGLDPRIPCLALAVRPRAGDDDSPVLTGLAVYRRNLVRLARDLEGFERELRRAVYEELASFFQLGDAERAELDLPPLPDAERSATAPVPAGRRATERVEAGGASSTTEAAPTPEPETKANGRRGGRKRSRKK